MVVAISRKTIEYRLNHASGFENAKFAGKYYVQVASNKTLQGAKVAVQQIRAMGYLARMSPVSCKNVLWGKCIDAVQRKTYMIFVARAARKSGKLYDIDPRYLNERPVRRKKRVRRMPVQQMPVQQMPEDGGEEGER